MIDYFRRFFHGEDKNKPISKDYERLLFIYTEDLKRIHIELKYINDKLDEVRKQAWPEIEECGVRLGKRNSCKTTFDAANGIQIFDKPNNI